VLPLKNDRTAIDGTRLAELLGRYQNIAAPSAADWLPQIPENDSDGLRSGLQKISEFADGRGWEVLNNGLDVNENTQLAATYRPSEIATLVSLSLGRLAEIGTFPR